MASLDSANQFVCRQCGKTFKAKPCKGRIYCGRACYALSKIVAPEIRFHAYVGPTTPEGCNLWTGNTNNRGYGMLNAMKTRGIQILAHRLAWELANGPVPDGMDVLHRCDNRSCVNAAHLFVGTAADNVADMIAKGRQKLGEQCRQAKVTEKMVREIRTRYAQGTISQSQLAEEFGISQSAICMITKMQRWKHI